jgi:hypothetical protein
MDSARQAGARTNHWAWIGTSWIVEVSGSRISDGKPLQGTYLFLTNLRTSPETLLQLVRDRWSIEGWHRTRDTLLHEHAQRYRGNGAGAMVTLRTAALNLLRLVGCQLISAGMHALMHDLTPCWQWCVASQTQAQLRTLNRSIRAGRNCIECSRHQSSGADVLAGSLSVQIMED